MQPQLESFEFINTSTCIAYEFIQSCVHQIHKFEGLGATVNVSLVKMMKRMESHRIKA